VSLLLKPQTARSKENIAMKRTCIVFALLATLFVSTSRAHTQSSTPSKKTPVTLAPDLSKLTIDKLLQQRSQPAKADSADDDASPLQVIAAFLQLQPGQVTELETLLQARQATLAPLVLQVQALAQQVEALLNSGGNPSQIGVLVIQIHALQQQIAQGQQAFLSQFLALLTPDQIQRLQAVEVAIQLQPVLPAFRLIFLF
jgi:hypothetical protein